MTRDEWMSMFRNFPEEEHGKLVLVLKNGTDICIDTIFRFEQNFLIIRGRMGGTIEEARGFFIPYEQMLYVRIERIMKLDDLEKMFAHKDDANLPIVPISASPTPTAHPTPMALPRPLLPTPNDPAAASRLLLDRIKAARTVTATKSAGHP